MTVVKSNHALKENNLYETEEWATEALLRRFPVSGLHVWEPCAGNHKMADVLGYWAKSFVTSDIETYGREHDFVADFLHPETKSYIAPKPDAIITNPPYGPGGHLGAKIIRKALERCDGLVAMLMTAKFDFGSTRKDLFQDNPRFTAKINLTDRIKWFGGEGSCLGTEDHAWYVWQKISDTPYPRLMYEGRTATINSYKDSLMAEFDNLPF